MEVESGSPEFDSFLGGSQNVPSGLNLSEFIKCRMEEVVMLTEAIHESPFRGQAFQRLPKHMRRRQMSHYIKRLPRRLQMPYQMSLKEGLPAPTKRPSRKFRRKPSNLLLEYNRRQRASVWLETHIWHAKRFHMIKKWGYTLPEKPVNKSFKACYRAISEHCLLIDHSYYNCIELEGPEDELCAGLRRCTAPECGLTFSAKMYIGGKREGRTTLFHPDSYPYRVISNVRFMWQPSGEDKTGRKIWIWVHPLVHDEVIGCFKSLFGLCALKANEELTAEEESEKLRKETETTLNGNHEPMELDGKSSIEKKLSPVEDEEMIIVEENVAKEKSENDKENTNTGKNVESDGKKDKRKKFRKERGKKFGKQIEAIKLEPKNVPFVRTPKYKSQSVTMTSLKDTLNRFQLTGPLSHVIVSQAFTVASVEKGLSKEVIEEVQRKRRKIEEEKNDRNWWENYYKDSNHKEDWVQQKVFYEKMGHWSKPTDVPAGMILGLLIEDPRLTISGKREKAEPSPKVVSQLAWESLDNYLSASPIWRPEIRDEVSSGKLTTQEINEAGAKKIVPGWGVSEVIPEEKKSKIPLLLVQRPGKGNYHQGKLGLGSGWDIIAPAGFGMPVWLSLIFRGARPGGLRESKLLDLECTNLDGCLPPDSAAGESDSRENLQNLKTNYFKLPPSKRANYLKLGVVSPFYAPWKILVRDWDTEKNKSEKDLSKLRFSVLRDYKLLKALEEIINNCPNGWSDVVKMPDMGWNFLIPVVIECCGKGKPSDLALVSLPEEKDLEDSSKVPSEPIHTDENKNERKRLRKEHATLLKTLRRKRKKEKAKMKEMFANGDVNWKEVSELDVAPSGPHCEEYKSKLEALWLADVDELESAGESCSRRVLGYVVRGEFSYSRARGLAVGYVTVAGLKKVLEVCGRKKRKALVLVRNNNEVQYRFGRLSIAINS